MPQLSAYIGITEKTNKWVVMESDGFHDTGPSLFFYVFFLFLDDQAPSGRMDYLDSSSSLSNLHTQMCIHKDINFQAMQKKL